MFGVPVDGPTDMFCNNEAVYKNSSTSDLVLRKKHHSVVYHKCREAVASGICRIAKEDTETNLAAIFTKVLPVPRRERLMDMFTYWKDQLIGNTEGLEWHPGDLLFLQREQQQGHLVSEYQFMDV